MADNHSTPILIRSEGEGQPLKRISLKKPPFDETGLQELLRRHPEILPISQLGTLSELYEPLISIGRETNLGNGCFLDNLFVSPYGYLTLVETKLWKNPEARREVVGQIIEYAKQLSKWTYDKLEDACKYYLKNYENKDMSLWEWVKSQSEEDIEEHIFIDTINNNLSLGQFKLLIVGEGIRHSAIEMTEFLHDTPHLRFNLALVELACYKLNEEGTHPYIVIPRIIKKTAEVERAVVTIRMAEDVKSRVKVDVATQAITSAEGQRSPWIEENVFFDELNKNIGEINTDKVRLFIGELENLGLAKMSGAISLSLRLLNPKDPDDPLRMTLLNFYINGKIARGGGFFVRAKRWGFESTPVENFVLALNKIHHGFHLKKTPRGEYGCPEVKVEQVVDKFPEIKVIIQKLLDEFHDLEEKQES